MNGPKRDPILGSLRIGFAKEMYSNARTIETSQNLRKNSKTYALSSVNRYANRHANMVDRFLGNEYLTTNIMVKITGRFECTDY